MRKLVNVSEFRNKISFNIYLIVLIYNLRKEMLDSLMCQFQNNNWFARIAKGQQKSLYTHTCVYSIMKSWVFNIFVMFQLFADIILFQIFPSLAEIPFRLAPESHINQNASLFSDVTRCLGLILNICWPRSKISIFCKELLLLLVANDI